VKAARKNPEDSRGGPNYNVDVRLLQQSQANTGEVSDGAASPEGRFALHKRGNRAAAASPLSLGQTADACLRRLIRR
jgi:hypothetical protein